MAADTIFRYWLWVDHVYDGDTIMGKLDLGLGVYLGGLPALQAHDLVTYSVRLYGINAPEMNDPDPLVRQAAQAARDYLQALVKPGEYLPVDSYGWDKYSKRIDGVVTNPQGVDVNQAMIDSGHAVTYMP